MSKINAAVEIVAATGQETNLNACVFDAQSDRVVVTSSGQPRSLCYRGAEGTRGVRGKCQDFGKSSRLPSFLLRLRRPDSGAARATSRSSPLFPLRLFRLHQRGGELLVEGKKIFDAVTVARERFRPITAIHGAIERPMGLHQHGGHRQ